MNKRDTREWQYVKPLIKGEYKLMANVSRNVGEWELDLYYIPVETLLSRFEDKTIRDEADRYEIQFNPIFGVYAPNEEYSSITLDDSGNTNSDNILDDRADTMRNNFTISLYQE